MPIYSASWQIETQRDGFKLWIALFDFIESSCHDNDLVLLIKKACIDKYNADQKKKKRKRNEDDGNTGDENSTETCDQANDISLTVDDTADF